MAMQCPACGGLSQREIGGGRYRCLTPRIVGILPPGIGPGPIGDLQPCGHVFTVLVGGCTDCRGPVMHVEGTPLEQLVCGDCYNARVSAQQTELRRQREVGEARRDRDRIRVTSQLPAIGDTATACELLLAHDELLAEATCRDVWLRFVRDGALTPHHEIVTVVGRPTVLGYTRSRGGYLAHGGRWEEVGARTGVFIAPEAGRRYVAETGLHIAFWTSGLDAWIDCDGNAGLIGLVAPLSFTGVHLKSTFKPKAGKTQRFILPAGQPFRTKSLPGQRGRYLDVPDAFTMGPHMQDPVGYARTVAGGLRAGTA